MTTPTTIFTGFLGSGKTTIISDLIDQLRTTGEQVAYIKNEVGSADIDTKLIQGKAVKTQELLNGCICCTLVGPFHTAINDLIKQFNPDRIIIEASGAADPSALALSVNSHPDLTRDGVICIIDVVNFEGFEDLSITAHNQTKFTDLLIFNKVELADLARKKAVVGYVRELNTHSPIIEATAGHINKAIIFGQNPKNLEQLLKDAQRQASGSLHQHTGYVHEDHHHVEADGFDAINLQYEALFNLESLTQALEQLPAPVFRAKALVKTDKGNQLCNKVASRVDWQPINYSLKTSTFIFIGHHINQVSDQITSAIENAVIRTD